MFKTALILYTGFLVLLFSLTGCTLWLDVDDKKLLITSERIENEKKTNEKTDETKN